MNRQKKTALLSRNAGRRFFIPQIAGTLGRWLLAALAALPGLLPPAATAANLTWTGLGADANWSTAANWGGLAPVNGDDLFFGAPLQTANFDDIAGLTIGGLTFNPAAPAFTLTINDQMLTINTLGIVNNSGVGQVFGVGGAITPGAFGSLQLLNNTVITAGAGVTVGNNPAAVAGGFFGYTIFANNANAGGATVNDFGGNAFSDGGMVSFLDTATASSATINNQPATVAGAAGGSAQFLDTATAGSALINNNGGAVLGAGTGFTEFYASATAGSATINNGSAVIAGAGSAFTEFNNTSTAGGATINNLGGTV
ncbi:MAG: hypothetical protein FJ388_26385, partial [Verrucomicrobia bacterium]|nr:hypothetical protein [Verrucomicrobiota bacterium]